MRTNVDSHSKHFFYADAVRCVVELHYYHKMAHRDIKPENYVLNDDLSLSFIDLGHSCGVMDVCTDKRGTKMYLPNEILVDEPEYFARSLDIFQLGVTLFIIMFGSMPWESSDYSCP